MKNKSIIFVIQEGINLASPLVRTLKSVTDSQILVYSSLDEIEEALMHSDPHLLVIDIDFSDKKIKSNIMNLISFNVPSIILSAEQSKDYAVGLLKKGAVDYILKEDYNYFEVLKESIKEIISVIHLRIKLKEQKRKQLRNLRNALILFSGTFIFIITLISYFKWGY